MLKKIIDLKKSLNKFIDFIINILLSIILKNNRKKIDELNFLSIFKKIVG